MRQRDGSVANSRLFADMNAGKGAGNPDGKTIYTAASSKLARIRVNAAGAK